MSYELIVKDIQARKFKSIYLLMGNESYYIDEITNLLSATVLPTEERDFNQHILYGMDTSASEVISLARSFPMMSKHQLIVIKEAQKLSKFEDLKHYTENPLKSTILVLNYKDGTPDKRKTKALFAGIEKHGVIFESQKIPDYKMAGFIASFAKTKGKDIDAKSSQMLADYLGNDLSKLNNELNKLIIALPASQTRISDKDIEENIGISKDYNNFELLKAVITKDTLKANQIAEYFESNPRDNPLFLSLIVLSNFFNNLMICYWARDKSERGLTTELGIRPFQAKDYAIALRNYNAFKTMETISLIRKCDAMGKGVDNPSTTHGELLRELLYKMMH